MANKLMLAADKSIKAIAPRDSAPGSLELRNRVHELYCRYRAQCLGKVDSFRKANQRFRYGANKTYSDAQAYEGAINLDRRRDIAERTQYLSRDETSAITAKRNRIEESLWNMHEADIGDCFEVTDKGIEQPKRLADMSPELRKTIEKITIDSKGRIIPQLSNKVLVSRELRAMLQLGRPSDASDVSRLSDAELVAQLSDQARQLGVDINLSYDFARHDQAGPADSDTEGQGSQVIDIAKDDTE